MLSSQLSRAVSKYCHNVCSQNELVNFYTSRYIYAEMVCIFNHKF